MRRPINLGHDRKTPLVLGYPNGDDARLVEGTGLYLAVRKGDRRWVTGSAVQNGLMSGVLINVDTGDPPPMSPAQLQAAVAAEPADSPPVGAVPADAALTALRAAPAAAAAPKTPAAADGAPAKKRPAKKRAPVKKAAPKKA